jgi:hypothetical protein
MTHIVSLSREVENYSYDQQTSMSRRDRRPGQQTGGLSHRDGGVQVDIKWGDPYAGKPAICSCKFGLNGRGLLRQCCGTIKSRWCLLLLLLCMARAPHRLAAVYLTS